MLRRRLVVGISAVSVAGLGVLGVAASGGGAQTVVDVPVPFTFTGASQTYTVPDDPNVCDLTISAAGANGGTSGVAGGTGGQVVATFPVVPGDVITVDVGGVGASVSSGAAGGSGGFGGGAAGGVSVGAGAVGGGGGGGATTISLNGSVILVAGGGGGSGNAGGNGGAGGSSATAGSDGQLGGGLSGGFGLGGTTSGGGTGGAAAGGDATAGGDGSPGVGGAGGTAATPTGAYNGGGGGGGGGFFGGGGGGGGVSDPQGDSASGGGGGGGGGFAAASTTGIGVGSLGQDTSGNGQAQITPVAGVCQPLLSILKVVTGQAPAGTTFTVHVVCSHVVITGVNAQASQTTVDRTLVFDALGHPFSGGNPTVIAAFTDTCNVTETASGGATTVSYTCRDNHSTDPPFCQASNQDVVFGRSRIESAGVIVTNAFPTPQVIIQPTYAG